MIANKIFVKILSSLLNTMLIVSKHCSGVYCDKFLWPQIDRKSKYAKEQWHEKFYLQSVSERLTKLEAIKMQFVCTFFHICWTSAEKLNF